LARYGVLLTWELTDLTAELAGHPIDLAHLRERLCPRSGPMDEGIHGSIR